MVKKRENERIDLAETEDFDSVLEEISRLRDSLHLSEEDKERLSCESGESFEDVEFHLLPSFDEDSEAFESEAVENEERESLFLEFTVAEQEEISLDFIEGMNLPILFRFTSDGALWLVDAPEDALFRFSHCRDGQVLHSFTIPRGREQFCIGFPGGVSTDAENNIYILDVAQQSVHKCSPEGEYDNNFQDRFMAASPLFDVRDMHLDEEAGLIYVTDYVRGSLKIFMLNGKEQDEIRIMEAGGPPWIQNVTGVASDMQGRIFIADPTIYGVAVLERSGDWVKGMMLEQMRGKGMPFISMLECGPDGSLFFADVESGEFLMYDSEGALKGAFSSRAAGTGGDFHLNYINVTSDRKIYILDRPAGKIRCLF